MNEKIFSENHRCYVQCWFDNFSHVSCMTAAHSLASTCAPIYDACARGVRSRSAAIVHAASTRPHQGIQPSWDFSYHLYHGGIVARDSGKDYPCFLCYIKLLRWCPPSLEHVHLTNQANANHLNMKYTYHNLLCADLSFPFSKRNMSFFLRFMASCSV